jgi:hypothetical protein
LKLWKRKTQPDWIQRIQVLDLNPGDVLFLTPARMVSMEAVARMQHVWESQWKGPAPAPTLFVLDPGTEVSAVRVNAVPPFAPDHDLIGYLEEPERAH